MPDFATAFTSKASERILTHNELVRAIRLCMADEFEAIQVYTQLAESIDNPLAKAVLLDIANEEKVHAGEFLRLLNILAPDESGFYQQGADEVDAQVKKMGGKPMTADQNETTIGSMKG
ncbi:MAG: rubrerythrin [Methanomicrobiales archaeon]|nr:rubrerythrin [Methanomicrobiales archaeon]